MTTDDIDHTNEGLAIANVLADVREASRTTTDATEAERLTRLRRDLVWFRNRHAAKGPAPARTTGPRLAV